jgi:hypothetical protein
MDEIRNEQELLCVLKKMGFSVYLSTFNDIIKTQNISLDRLVKEWLRFNNVPGSISMTRESDRIVYKAQYDRVYKIAKDALDDCRNKP